MSNAINTTTVNNATAQDNGVEIIKSMMQRIGDLAVTREVWEATEYTRSNQALYKLIADCLALYNDLAFPQISRQIMMSKLNWSHANATYEICRRV